MRIGLVGDTHIPEAAADLPAAAYEYLSGCDRILHCGDLHSIDVVERLEQVAETAVSRGNGDTLTPRIRRPGVPADPRVMDVFLDEIVGFRVGMTHDLSLAEERSDDEVRALLSRTFGHRVDIAISGHTHVPMVRGLDDGTVLVNPGSPTMPYGYLGLDGTLGILEIDPGRFRVTIVDLETGASQLELDGPGPRRPEFGPRPSRGR